MSRRSGHLFDGYGGLSRAADAWFGTDAAWHSEIEPAAVAVLEHHYPGRPNLGDITTVEWAEVEPVDVVSAGYPCQPFSAAGRRGGSEDDRYLWPAVADCLAALRPTVFVGENVRGHLSLGFDQVLRDLDLIGYDVSWSIVRAADVGAPHARARLFIVGRDRGTRLCGGTGGRRGLHRGQPCESSRHLCDSRGRRDGDEVQPDPEPAPLNLRRPTERDETGDRAERSEDPVGGRWSDGGELPTSDPASSTPQGRAGSDLPGPARGHQLESGAARAASLVPGTAAPGRDREAARDGAQQPRTRAVPAEPALGDADSDPAVGSLVGAGRVPLRAGAVHWQLPGERTDDRGSRVRMGYSDGVGTGRRAGADPAELGCGAEGWDDGLRTEGLVAELADADRSGREGAEPAAGRHVPARRTAADATDLGHERRGDARDGRAGPSHGGVGTAADARGERRGEGWPEPARVERGSDAPVSGDVTAADSDSDGLTIVGEGAESDPRDDAHRCGADSAWGDYGPAVRRWERVLGRPAPGPTQTGARGGQQLSPRFVEWLMGLPEGWVTDVPGLSRNQQLKLLGNGVVPQQAQLALSLLSAQAAAEVVAA